MLHSCIPRTESFSPPDSPADGRIMNSQIFSNLDHPIPMFHIGTIHYFILWLSALCFFLPKYLRQRRPGRIPLRPRHLLKQPLRPKRFSDPRQMKHLGLWRVKSRPIPKAHAPPALNHHGSGSAGYILDHFSQLPLNDDHLYRDPDYPWDAYLQS